MRRALQHRAVPSTGTDVATAPVVVTGQTACRPSRENAPTTPPHSMRCWVWASAVTPAGPRPELMRSRTQRMWGARPAVLLAAVNGRSIELSVEHRPRCPRAATPGRTPLHCPPPPSHHSLRKSMPTPSNSEAGTEEGPALSSGPFCLPVGMTGFEPATPWRIRAISESHRMS